MIFISKTTHEKFVQQCQSLLENPGSKGLQEPDKELKHLLLNDLYSLQSMAETYMSTIAQLPAISKDYYHLQKIIRIRIRKMQQAELNRAEKK